MLKPKWISTIESYFPEKITGATSSFKGYARSLGRAAYSVSFKRIQNYSDFLDVFVEEVEKFQEELNKKD